ncbi:hypothetical protein PV08_10872 [Exophiala spinifera]|uniref:Uncharacterized protein n=1 Tax=Exophiala spinifera TaxID=91928 RepID=A0A0D1Y9C2_9EURO|nr:uncharacterized protein PV08_10872 [Exophiala spinifera]KIW11571.1 hypothetical protein PV08_10872 [Exophiala spinifera]
MTATQLFSYSDDQWARLDGAFIMCAHSLHTGQAPVTKTDTTADLDTQRQPPRSITGHNGERKAIIQAVVEGNWRKIDNDIVRYNEMWAISKFPADIKNDGSLQKTRTIMSVSLPVASQSGKVIKASDTLSNPENLQYYYRFAKDETLLDAVSKAKL